MQGLVGDQSNGADQSLQLVTQHLMEAEQALQAAAKIKPELSGIVSKFINDVKPQAGQILFGAGGGQSQPSQPQPNLMGMLAGPAQGNTP
jgi:hypothetical protein